MTSTTCIIEGHSNCERGCSGRLRDKRRQEREKHGEAPLRAPRTREGRHHGYRERAKLEKVLDQVKSNPHFSLESSNPLVVFDKTSRAYAQHQQNKHEADVAMEKKKLSNRVSALLTKETKDEWDF